MTLSNKSILGSVVILTLLGFALRFYHLNTVPLRGDEAFTVLHWMREPLAQTLANIATVDPQAPLSYALYRGWGLLMGTSEYVARILPALLSVIAIPTMYALGHRLKDSRLGLLAAFLWAINPEQIWHAQDARNYAIWAVLSLLAVWLALRALEKRRRVDWLLYIAAGVLAAYVYYLELFIIVVLNLYVLFIYGRERRLLLHWIGAEAIIGLILAPWYLQPRLLVGSGYGGTGGHFEALQWITRFIPALTFGTNLPANFLSYLAPVIALVLLISLVLALRRSRQQAVLLAFWGTIPLVLLGIVSTKLNVFEPRYVLAVAPVYILLLGMLIVALPYDVLKGWLIVAVVLVSSFTLKNYYFSSDYAKSPDWRALASYLSKNTQPGDWVTQAAADESFTFYCNEYHVASNCDDKLPASPGQPKAEIDQLLTMRTQQHSAIWYVASLTDWQNGHTAEDWLKANMQQVRSTSADGLPALEFKPWQVSSAEITSTPLATFGDSIELVGIKTSTEPTDDLNVWLYWRALEPTSAPQKVFLHLGTPDQIVTQDDHYPQNGRISTDSWEVGMVYRDIYTLPLNGVPTGDYSLAVGFYDPETNRRLPVGNGDSFTIQSIHVH